jgi:hypothetical protein
MEDSFLGSITSTCFHFRSVALKASFLWSNLLVGPGNVSLKMRSYMERSGTAPIRLTLVVDNEFNQWTSDRIKGWMESLHPYLARSQRITLRTTCHEVTNMILPIRIPMPDLREFILDARNLTQHGDATEHRHIILLDHPASLPETYSITVCNPSLSISWDRSIPHIRHLSLVDLAGLPTPTVVDLVAQCPELKSLRWLHYLEEDTPYAGTMPPFTSSSLEALDMDLPDHGDPSSSLLTRMHFPRLRHLVLSAYSSNTQWADRAVASMARFPCLRTVWISSYAFSPEAAIEYLTAHPTVEEFGCGMTSSIGAFISLLNEPTCFVPWTSRLPKLRFIHFLDASYPSSAVVVGMSLGLRALMRDHGLGTDDKSEFKVQLNDQSWRDTSNIPIEYTLLANDFPRNITLSSNEDTLPTRFRPGQYAWGPEYGCLYSRNYLDRPISFLRHLTHLDVRPSTWGALPEPRCNRIFQLGTILRLEPRPFIIKEPHWTC